jgi:hypothetical protein
MADAIDAAKFLDVDMDQFAGPLAFVADGVRAGIEGGHP